MAADRPSDAGVALFSAGLRPFFLAGAGWAALTVPLWVLSYLGMASDAGFDRDWHVHEMLFGYLAAIIAGFLLTSAPNWTRRKPLVGAPLAMLFSLWAAGRIAMLFQSVLGPPATGVIDCAFLIGLTVIVTSQIVRAANWSNLGVCALVAVLAAANVAFHARLASADTIAFATRAALSGARC